MPVTVVMTSGGMDSTVLIWDLVAQGQQPTPLFVNYGQHCHEHELSTLKEVLPPHLKGSLEVVNISDVYRSAKSAMVLERDLWQDDVKADDLYLPYRTLLLLSTAAAFAQACSATSVQSAFINSNHAKEIDCSAEFFGRLEAVFGVYGGVSLLLPYRYLSKYEVARKGLALGAPIASTFSCQASSQVPCGVCPNCVDRLSAFRQLRADHEPA